MSFFNLQYLEPDNRKLRSSRGLMTYGDAITFPKNYSWPIRDAQSKPFITQDQARESTQALYVWASKILLRIGQFSCSSDVLLRSSHRESNTRPPQFDVGRCTHFPQKLQLIGEAQLNPISPKIRLKNPPQALFIWALCRRFAYEIGPSSCSSYVPHHLMKILETFVLVQCATHLNLLKPSKVYFIFNIWAVRMQKLVCWIDYYNTGLQTE